MLITTLFSNILYPFSFLNMKVHVSDTKQRPVILHFPAVRVGEHPTNSKVGRPPPFGCPFQPIWTWLSPVNTVLNYRLSYTVVDFLTS
jgi:hypothetical protein